MTNEEAIISQLHQLPESLKREVLHYIEFLREQNNLRQELASPKTRIFGSAKDKYKLAEDFNAPLEDFKEYM